MIGIKIAKVLLGLFISSILVCFVYIIVSDHRASSKINKEIIHKLKDTSLNSYSIESLLVLKQTSSVFSKVKLLIVGGFMIVLVGCVFVLLGIETSYKLSLDHTDFKSYLKTSSPGLVIATLGILLLSVVTYKNYDTSSNIENLQQNPNPVLDKELIESIINIIKSINKTDSTGHQQIKNNKDDKESLKEHTSKVYQNTPKAIVDSKVQSVKDYHETDTIRRARNILIERLEKLKKNYLDQPLRNKQVNSYGNYSFYKPDEIVIDTSKLILLMNLGIIKQNNKSFN
jgi:hypothetical protein